MEIPQILQTQTGITNSPYVRADTYPRDERVSSLAPGLKALAAGEEALATGQQYQADAFERSQVQADKTRTGAAIMGGVAELTQNLDALHNDIANDPNGIDPAKFGNLTPRVQKMVSDLSDKVAGEATTQQGKDMVREHLNTLWATKLLPHVLTMQAGFATAYATNNIASTMTNGEAAVAANPGLFDTVLNLTNDSIKSAENLPFELRLKFQNAAQTRYAWAATNTLARQHPEWITTATKGPLALQPALRGLATDETGTVPLAPQPPIIGAPIPEQAPPPEVLAKMVALQKKGTPVSWRADTGMLTGAAALNPPPLPSSPNIATAAVTPLPEPPAAPPTDAEISAKIPAWKYLTPEHQQTFRNQAATLLNQQGALAIKALNDRMHEDIAFAAEGFVPPNPLTPPQIAAVYGENSKQQNDYNQAMLGGAMRTMLAGMTKDDQVAALERLRPQYGQNTAAAFKVYNDAANIVRTSLNAEQKAALDALSAEVKTTEGLAALGKVPDQTRTLADFTKAIKDPEAAQNAFAAYSRILDMGRAIRDLPNTSREQVPGVLAQFEPNPNNISEAASKLETWRTASRAALADDKARTDDPAAYVLRSNPDLAQQRAAAYGKDGTPVLVQAYLQNSVAQQQRLQLPDPSLLSAGDIQRLDQQINAPVLSGQGDDAVSRLRKIEQQYGPYYPQVIEELQKDGKVKFPDAGYSSIMYGKNVPTIQAQDAQLQGVKIKDFGVDEPRVKQAETAIRAAMAPFYASVVSGASNTALQAVGRTVVKRALSAMSTSPNMDATQAVNDAAKPLLDQFRFFSNRGDPLQMMIPADEQPDLVQRGAQAITAILSRLTVDVPLDRYGDMKPDEAAARYASDIQRNPIWLTNNNQTGLVLFTRDKYGVLAPVTGQGKQLSYLWDAFRAQAQNEPAYATPQMTAPDPRVAAAFAGRQRGN